MTQFETLALQGRTSHHSGLAAIDAERLKRLRSQSMRLCFSHISEQRYRLEHVARVRGTEYINDASSRTVNATWYALHTLEGRLIWIVGSAGGDADYRRILPVAREKVAMMICVGPADDMRQAFGGVVDRIEEASSIGEAVHMAYCANIDAAKVVFSPACGDMACCERDGEAFIKEVREL